MLARAPIIQYFHHFLVSGSKIESIRNIAKNIVITYPKKSKRRVYTNRITTKLIGFRSLIRTLKCFVFSPGAILPTKSLINTTVHRKNKRQELIKGIKPGAGSRNAPIPNLTLARQIVRENKIKNALLASLSISFQNSFHRIPVRMNRQCRAESMPVHFCRE